jgi:sulfur transfer protein SufE
MSTIPEPLADLLDEFALLDRRERADLLIEAADRFQEVPPEVATRPFPEENYVVRCESQAYVWPIERADGTLKYYFAIENPQGLSARAWAVIMDETLSGAPLDQVVSVSPEVIFGIFGKDISMGKGQGLMGMLDHVTSAAKRRLRG